MSVQIKYFFYKFVLERFSLWIIVCWTIIIRKNKLKLGYLSLSIFFSIMLKALSILLQILSFPQVVFQLVFICKESAAFRFSLLLILSITMSIPGSHCNKKLVTKHKTHEKPAFSWSQAYFRFLPLCLLDLYRSTFLPLTHNLREYVSFGLMLNEPGSQDRMHIHLLCPSKEHPWTLLRNGVLWGSELIWLCFPNVMLTEKRISHILMFFDFPLFLTWPFTISLFKQLFAISFV